MSLSNLPLLQKRTWRRKKKNSQGNLRFSRIIMRFDPCNCKYGATNFNYMKEFLIKKMGVEENIKSRQGCLADHVCT